jgi:hypothetical protein
MQIYRFRCGHGQLRAFSRFQDGRNLPTDRCPEGWIFEALMSCARANEGRIGFTSNESPEMLAEVEREGFAIREGSATNLPPRTG